MFSAVMKTAVFGEGEFQMIGLAQLAERFLGEAEKLVPLRLMAECSKLEDLVKTSDLVCAQFSWPDDTGGRYQQKQREGRGKKARVHGGILH